MLLSLHVPKCAGTSFALVLKRIFGARLWLNYGAIFRRGEAREGIIPQNTECIHGHFEADAFDDLYPKSPMVTWVRHPVERLASNYHYFLRHPGPNDHFCQVLHERNLKLTEFAELEGMQNVATRHLLGRPLDQFKFVGVSERFPESMAVFSHSLGLEDGGTPPRVNYNPERTQPRYELSPSEFDRIAAMNTADLELYNEANRRLDRELASVRSTRGNEPGPKPTWTVI